MIFKSKQMHEAPNAKESVFDPVSGKFIAEIIGETYETSDDVTIETLKRLGYEIIDEQSETDQEEKIKNPKKGKRT
jgi:hypothetical protein